jgi:iron(III) transport system substrate-binding protein
MRLPQLRLLPLSIALALGASACSDSHDVVVYCALDQVHSEPLIRRFEERTGLKVRAEFDIEAHKTVGLVTRIREERSRPRCDVFWNNEIVQTIGLAQDGLLAAYDSPSAADIPEAFRDPERRWTGFAARARVFIVNSELIDPAEVTRLDDLLDPKWKGRCAMARPLTGTTLTHFATLIDVLGEEATFDFLRRAMDGQVNLLPGNGQVMRMVREGRAAFGLTDTDDYNVALEGGFPVASVYPDQDGPGTLVIPNTVSILADAPHPEAARKLVDFLLSTEVEQALAESASAQIPVRAAVPRPAHVKSAADFTVMAVDFARVGGEITARQQRFNEMFRE